MIRARIVVEGEVQRVGYRDLVQRIARELGVKGFVENLRDGTVQIVCEAKREVLGDFVNRISVKEDFVDVKRAQIVETSLATGEFGYFDVKFGPLEEELGDRMGVAIKYAGAMWRDMKEMRGAVKEMHGDLKGDLIGLREDLKEEAAGIRGVIKEMHGDLKEEMVGMRGDIKGMHVDMSRSFQEMAKRYDAISAELIRTREELTRAVDSLSKLIDEFIKERRAESRR